MGGEGVGGCGGGDGRGWEGRVWVGVGERVWGKGDYTLNTGWGEVMGGCEGVSKNGAREKEKIVPRDAGSNFTLYVY